MLGMGDAISVGPVDLTRLESATVLGAAITLVGMALPWLTGPARSATGFTYGPISPVLAGGAALAAVLAALDGRDTWRFGLLALAGVTLAAWGVILTLGIPGPVAGAGIYVTAVGGFAVAAAGYTGLVRRTSTLVATAVVCGGALVVNTVLMVALLQ